MNSKSVSARKRDLQINRPKVYVETIYAVELISPMYCGGNEYLEEEQVAEYEANPDLFAARHYGFANAEYYREWVQFDGCPRCSETNKRGFQCNGFIGKGRARNAAEWFARHRNSPCRFHGGE
jgi:hypothetical protein